LRSHVSLRHLCIRFKEFNTRFRSDGTTHASIHVSNFIVSHFKPSELKDIFCNDYKYIYICIWFSEPCADYHLYMSENNMFRLDPGTSWLLSHTLMSCSCVPFNDSIMIVSSFMTLLMPRNLACQSVWRQRHPVFWDFHVCVFSVWFFDSCLHSYYNGLEHSLLKTASFDVQCSFEIVRSILEISGKRSTAFSHLERHCMLDQRLYLSV
jgi:hypothetical protein